MENLATKIKKTYKLHLDFDDLTGHLDCLYDNHCHTVIDFEFDFEIENVSHDKGDYYTPECTTYDINSGAYGFVATRIRDDKDIEVSSQIREIINLFLEDDIRRYIDENELYNNY